MTYNPYQCDHQWHPSGPRWFIWSDNKTSPKKEHQEGYYYQQESCFLCGLTRQVMDYAKPE